MSCKHGLRRKSYFLGSLWFTTEPENYILTPLTWGTGLWCCAAGWGQAASCSSSCLPPCSLLLEFSSLLPDGFCCHRFPQDDTLASHNLSESCWGEAQLSTWYRTWNVGYNVQKLNFNSGTFLDHDVIDYLSRSFSAPSDRLFLSNSSP